MKKIKFFKKKNKFNSITFKLPAMLVSITLTATIISYININIFIQREFRSKLDEQTSLISSSLNWALSPLIEEEKIDSIQRIVEQIGAYTFVEKIRILDKYCLIVSSNDTLEINKELKLKFLREILEEKKLKAINVDIKNLTYEAAFPIRTSSYSNQNQSDISAILYIKANVKTESLIFENLKNTLILEKIIIIILMAVSIYFTITHMILRPVKKIQNGMHELSKGNYIHKVDMKASNEINDFAELFNHMATQINESSEMLKKSKNEAEELSKMKTVFLSNMSHEIRTPLNAIIGFSEILEEDEEEKEKKEQLNIIVNAGKHLLELINDILDFSKMESNNFKIKNEPFSLKKLLKNVSDMFIIRETVDLKFIVKKMSDMPEFLIGDRKLISQIIINLMSNSFKFTKYGQVSLMYKYDFRKNIFKFVVQDTGIGIPKDKLKYIFTPFEQVDNMYSKRFAGTGLGLSITSNLIKMMNGKIYVRSIEKKGTLFFVKLPLSISEIEIIENNSDSKTIIESDLEGSKETEFNLLIAEDIMDNIKLLKVILKKAEANIDYSLNGKEALKKLNEKKYDLLLLDMQMPELSGYDLIKIIRNDIKLKNLYVIALTAFSLAKEKDDILNSGCNDYLSKPLNKNELRRKVAERISAKQKLRKKSK